MAPGGNFQIINEKSQIFIRRRTRFEALLARLGVAGDGGGEADAARAAAGRRERARRRLQHVAEKVWVIILIFKML